MDLFASEGFGEESANDRSVIYVKPFRGGDETSDVAGAAEDTSCEVEVRVESSETTYLVAENGTSFLGPSFASWVDLMMPKVGGIPDESRDSIDGWQLEFGVVDL